MIHDTDKVEAKGFSYALLHKKRRVNTLWHEGRGNSDGINRSNSEVCEKKCSKKFLLSNENNHIAPQDIVLTFV